MNLRQELHYQYRCLRLGWGFLTGRFINCNLQITYRCNFKCQICDFWKERHDPADELSLEDIKTIGRKLNELGTIIISLAGGEPLVREDIYDIITALNAAGHFPILITNGWHVDEAVARDILRAGLQEISVSVDYRSNLCASTFGGGRLAMITGLEVLDILKEERLADRAAELGSFLLDGLRGLAAKHPVIREVRGRGLVAGIEFALPTGLLAAVVPNWARQQLFAQVAAAVLLRDHNLLTQTCGLASHVLRVEPPLVISREEIQGFLVALDQVLTELKL
jgi:hypothetical protein